ncbi:PH domain-containing protein [Altererythrobacter sp. MTPC7]|uniref:PH domain-containing protein n=1 Tax=Altererythrobacter sp. MTPC7 TaxID=3056567 RepID=UPI0036F1D7F3
MTDALPDRAVEGEPDVQRTDPLSVVVKAIVLLPQLVLPLGAAAYSIGGDLDGGEVGIDIGSGIGWLLMLLAAVIAANLAVTYLQWRRFTYRVGEADIRVESGILSRAARSVPYDRIQDVSLEQKFVARLLGLVEVRFETGAGGKDELTLAYLSQADGEALREVVRERRDDAQGEGTPAQEKTVSPEAEGEAIFTMGPRRLATFGLFEFSLAAVAVLAAAVQQADFLLPFDLWSEDFWGDVLAGPGRQLASLGLVAQITGVVLVIGTLLVVGLATGLVRTFLRDWDFRLDRTAKGFRRRRGLLTRTDVVMPAHRVQALRLTTGVVRRRFGWRGLKFVSLAQDSGDASHVVAPFAKDAELLPIAAAAGFSPPGDDLRWARASGGFRIVSAIVEGGTFLLIALGIEVALAVSGVDLIPNQKLVGLLPLAAAAVVVLWQYLLWRAERHAISEEQVFIRTGFFSPELSIGNRVKLQSAEISQGPVARWMGFSTLHLGLAGGKLSVPGMPVDRARKWRSAVLDSMATRDFSRLL